MHSKLELARAFAGAITMANGEHSTSRDWKMLTRGDLRVLPSSSSSSRLRLCKEALAGVDRLALKSSVGEMLRKNAFIILFLIMVKIKIKK